MNQYDKLLALPLFQGLSQHDLWDIVESTPFAFNHYCAHQPIVVADSSCNRLIFLIDGMMSVRTESADHAYSLTESVKAPLVIEPERLFGLTQRYLRSYTSLTSANTLSITKQDVVLLTEQYIIFRLNLLNIITTQSQRHQLHPWLPAPKDLWQRIVRFLTRHCLHPAGEKVFSIKMQQLAGEVNASRLEVSRVLNNMQEQGLIHLKRGHICIPALEKLR